MCISQKCCSKTYKIVHVDVFPLTFDLLLLFFHRHLLLLLLKRPKQRNKKPSVLIHRGWEKLFGKIACFLTKSGVIKVVHLHNSLIIYSGTCLRLIKISKICNHKYYGLPHVRINKLFYLLL